MVLDKAITAQDRATFWQSALDSQMLAFGVVLRGCRWAVDNVHGFLCLHLHQIFIVF